MVQIFAVVLDQVMGNTLMAGVVTSGAFCAMVAGGCGESCAGMNPAAPIASQVPSRDTGARADTVRETVRETQWETQWARR